MYSVEPCMLEFPFFKHFAEQVAPSMILQSVHQVGKGDSKAGIQFLQALSDRKLVSTDMFTSTLTLASGAAVDSQQ